MSIWVADYQHALLLRLLIVAAMAGIFWLGTALSANVRHRLSRMRPLLRQATPTACRKGVVDH